MKRGEPKLIHKKRKKKTKVQIYIDKIVYVLAILVPILTLPQLFKIWVNQTAQGVSLTSWATYLIASIVWLIYGVIHKAKPLIIMYILWIIIDLVIVIGIIMYS